MPSRNDVHLSVIIPTLNRLKTARLLAGRVRELLPALDIEVIVVTPSTNLQAAPLEPIRYVVDAGEGVYAAYNRGLHSATGEYVWFLGDDDYPLDGAQNVSTFLQEGTVDLLVAPVLFSSGKIYRPTRTLLILHFLNWCQQGVIYRRRELLRHRFFRRLSVQADQYVNILIRSNPTVGIRYLSDPICMFGVHGVSGRLRDEGYSSLRLALARRTLSCPAFLAFRVLLVLEPMVKRLMNIRS
jgi:glycosyltransferase involved in cell wall biosynthesis